MIKIRIIGLGHVKKRTIIEDLDKFVADKKATEKLQQNIAKVSARTGTQLPDELIFDTDRSVLVDSSSSNDSLKDLVIRRADVNEIFESETDDDVSDLPTKQQAIIASNQLADTLESIQYRYRIKVARDKYKKSREPAAQVPEIQLPIATEQSFEDAVVAAQQQTPARAPARALVISPPPSPVPSPVRAPIPSPVSEPRINEEEDLRQLTEYLASRVNHSSLIDENTEQSIIELLLRQSDSLWDPIVVYGIPIGHFIPSRSDERSLLDTSTDKKSDDSILADDEMNFDDLIDVIEPTNEYVETEEEILKQINAKNDYYRELISGRGDETRPKLQHPTKTVEVPSSKALKVPSTKTPEVPSTKAPKVPSTKAPTEPSTKPPKVPSTKSNHSLPTPQLVETASRIPPSEDTINSFLRLIEFDENEPEYGYYVDVEQLEIPAFFYNRIIRNVDNCPHHIAMVRALYNKYRKYYSQPRSSTDSTIEGDRIFYEVVRLLADGRICARLTSCGTGTSTSTRYDRNSVENSSSQVTERQSSENEFSRKAFEWMGPMVTIPRKEKRIDERYEESKSDATETTKMRKSVSFSNNVKPGRPKYGGANNHATTTASSSIPKPGGARNVATNTSRNWRDSTSARTVNQNNTKESQLKKPNTQKKK